MIALGVFLTGNLVAQINVTISNPEAVEVLEGNYDPASYTPGVIINHPDSILQGVINLISKDTMIANLQHIDSYYFDTIYTFVDTNHLLIEGLDETKTYYFSVANVENGVESLFCDEYSVYPVGIEGFIEQQHGIILRQNHPNPFDLHTEIVVELYIENDVGEGEIRITDLAGRVEKVIPVDLKPGLNHISFTHSGKLKGMYTYSLVLKNGLMLTKKMIIL